MPIDDPDKLQALMAAFDPDSPDAMVTQDDIIGFLGEVGEYHLDATIGDDKYATKMVKAGYTTRHSIAELTSDDLLGMGFKHAHARHVAKYLAGRAPTQKAGEPAPGAAPSYVTDLSNTSAQLGAVMVAALDDQKKEGKLNHGAEGRPSVAAAVAWGREHSDKSKAAVGNSGNGLSEIFKKVIKNAMVDLEPFILAEPIRSADEAYFAKLKGSLTSDQFAALGDGEDKSAAKLMQNVIKNAANKPMVVYLKEYQSFTSMGVTSTPSAVKQRYNEFKKKLQEIRYHKMFDVKDALKHLMQIISPHDTMKYEVMALWNASTKDQQAISDLISAVNQPVLDEHEEASNATPANSPG